MKTLILVLIIILNISLEEYEELFNQRVSEEYINKLIGNITELIKEGYVFYDFYKAPKQPRPGYIPKMDLVEELNKIKELIEHSMIFIEMFKILYQEQEMVILIFIIHILKKLG